MSNWLVKYRFWILGATLVLALVCGVLMLHVNINTDMTKYLPADSRMKAGLDLLQEELGMSADMAGGGIRVMTRGQTSDEMVDMRYQLSQLPEVASVTLQECSDFTLYELGVDKGIDQITLSRQIEKEFPHAIVESSQDGTTADGAMLIGALSLLLIVLAAMCSSWLEPVLFLASTGVAVLLNMGSNALLPSVSMTTHSIAAILQLVLSMDYSIILLNRYRQERQQSADSLSSMRQAIRKSAPAVLSSALTTIVGLMMLVFMKLRIGADLGIVLSKGVLFSLICNFTVLPSLILIFERGIERTQKRVLALPTQRLARFSMRYRLPLLIFFGLLLCSSYWLHNQTPISFHNAQPSAIDPLFPKKNPVVLVYSNADEAQVSTLVDSLIAQPQVKMAISYPTLMLKEYTVPQMLSSIQDLSAMVNSSDAGDNPLPLEMLSEDVLRLVYYAARGKRIATLDFETLASFLIDQSKDPNSFLASQMSADMKQKMAMFEDFRQMDVMIAEADSLADTVSSELPIKVESTVAIHEESRVETVPEVEDRVEASAPAYSPFADTSMLKTLFSSEEMASFLGMEASQAKMVYRLARHADQQMTPLSFVHFLTDDILKRKALAAMISSAQRQQLLALRATMDSAMNVKPHVQPAVTQQPVEIVEQPAPMPLAEERVEALAHQDADSLVDDGVVAQAEDPLTLLDELMTGHRQYSASEMARNFSAMDEPVNPALIELLYLYYGGIRYFNGDWKLSLHDMISFLGDTLMNDPRFSLFITPDMRQGMEQGRKMMDEKLGMMHGQSHSAAVVVTGLPIESDATYDFIHRLDSCCRSQLTQPYHLVGESVMMTEMKSGFGQEMLLVTLLTIVAILLIVAFSFRSILVAVLLVSTVMTGVFVDVSVSAIGGGSLLYMAYLVVQSILMGAAIDYGILFANYYREKRATLDIAEALRSSYQGSIHTILTSGLILILVPGAMSFLVADPTVSSIVRAISLGALATVVLVLFVLPGMLASCDRWIVKTKQRPQ